MLISRSLPTTISNLHIHFQSAAVIGWVVTWVVGVFLCYITFSKRREGGEEWPRWWEALYESVGRPLWAACVAWIIFACHNNRGGNDDADHSRLKLQPKQQTSSCGFQNSSCYHYHFWLRHCPLQNC